MAQKKVLVAREPNNERNSGRMFMKTSGNSLQVARHVYIFTLMPALLLLSGGIETRVSCFYR
jgi:hypothetical protein